MDSESDWSIVTADSHVAGIVSGLRKEHPNSRLAHDAAEQIEALTRVLRAERLSAHHTNCRNNAIHKIYFDLLCNIDPSGALIPTVDPGDDPRESIWTDRESMLAMITDRHAEGNAIRKERDELRLRLAERDASLVRAVRAK